MESTEKVINNFENIKDAIKGLQAILNIMDSKENDLFIKLCMDNLKMLYQNFLELIFNDYGLRQLMRKIRSSEIELNIPLENNGLLSEKDMKRECRKKSVQNRRE